MSDDEAEETKYLSPIQANIQAARAGNVEFAYELLYQFIEYCKAGGEIDRDLIKYLGEAFEAIHDGIEPGVALNLTRNRGRQTIDNTKHILMAYDVLRHSFHDQKLGAAVFDVAQKYEMSESTIRRAYNEYKGVVGTLLENEINLIRNEEE